MLRASGSICLCILIVCGTTSARQHPSKTRSTGAETNFARLRSKIDVEQIGAPAMNSVAGHYSSNPEELRKRVGPPLGGDDLYLFPDGSYLYIEWADILPATIQDKGTWAISAGEISLTSDPDITWKTRTADRHYLLARRSSHASEVLAVGTNFDLAYFEKHAEEDPEFMLLVCSKLRVNEISENVSVELKKKLMREAWRPEFYRSK